MRGSQVEHGNDGRFSERSAQESRQGMLLDVGRPAGKVTYRSVMALLRYQGFACAITGLELDPKTASLDHIVPRANGGGDTIENCHIIHRELNRMKGTLSMEEFVDWCRLVSDSQEGGCDIVE